MLQIRIELKLLFYYLLTIEIRETFIVTLVSVVLGFCGGSEA